MDTPASPEEKEQLMRELKKRLLEIQELKRKLGIIDNAPAESPPVEIPPGINSDAVRDALEELVVPPLELLDDKPQAPKKKKMDGQEQSA